MNKKIHNPDAELLKIVIAGSVDDGKSTLIGRLFFDLDEIYDDQLAAIKKASQSSGAADAAAGENFSAECSMDLSFFTDGLSAEREQKITIDVAYRYFATAKRRFIVADVPGHEEYTRNMATGAANSDLALILVDARKGLLTQSKRHLFLASFFGIKHILVVINKMDLVGYREEVFEKIKNDFQAFARKLNVPDLEFAPVSATSGDMIVNRGANLPWYQGATVLSYLENVSAAAGNDLINFRLPVQLVLRPNQDTRVYAGTIAGGVIKVGEEIVVLPSRQKAAVKAIFIGEQNIDYAFSPQAVAVALDRPVDVSRGDCLVRENNLPAVNNLIEAQICFLADIPLEKGRGYWLKHTAKETRAVIEKIIYRLNIDTLHREEGGSLGLNQIGKVYLKTAEPLIFDAFLKNKKTGSFVLVDEFTHNTVAAGVIVDQAAAGAPAAAPAVDHRSCQKGAVLWFTGLSGSGKSAIADALAARLAAAGVDAERLDGDLMRESFSRDLGFSPADRDKNIDRASFVAGLLSAHGVLVLATFVSPYARHRALAAERARNFAEIFVNTPLAECERRDVKGLYQKARRGEIAYFTGISDVYEEPNNPALTLRADQLTLNESVDIIWEYLRKNNFIL